MNDYKNTTDHALLAAGEGIAINITALVTMPVASTMYVAPTEEFYAQAGGAAIYDTLKLSGCITIANEFKIAIATEFGPFIIDYCNVVDANFAIA